MVIEFFTQERGIREETLTSFGVLFDGDTASFPYSAGTKFRRHDEEGKRHFWSEPKGVALGLFTVQEPANSSVAFLVEGETDTMRLWQELGESVDVYGLPGIDTWTADYTPIFSQYETIYVILDNEKDYRIAARVDTGWYQIRKSLGRRARRVVLPEETKDVCEFFDKYDLDALRLLTEQKQGIWHYEALDLSRDPGPIDWLVEGVVARGDLALLIGEPGAGKSWVSMALAVSVASGQSTFLGREKDSHAARVLYIDEENPEHLVLRRMRRLGLTEEAAENIRFLHRQGIRLDRKPELLLDEVLDWGPDLIVLDSLTRMHTGDENNAGEVAKLFNDGINPLARESGATTLLLHHVTKTEGATSFARARGSGDISASVDTGLDLKRTDVAGGFSLAMYKSRWVEEGARIRGQRRDVDEDSTILEAVEHVRLF